MATIGRVTISPTGQQSSVRIKQATQTTIANPNFEPQINVSLDSLTDVETAGIQNGYTIVYDSATQKYKAGQPTANVSSIVGGSF